MKTTYPFLGTRPLSSYPDFDWRRSAKRDAWLLALQDAVAVVPFNILDRRKALEQAEAGDATLIIVATGQWRSESFLVDTFEEAAI